MIYTALALIILAAVFAIVPLAVGSLARRLYDRLTNRKAQGP